MGKPVGELTGSVNTLVPRLSAFPQLRILGTTYWKVLSHPTDLDRGNENTGYLTYKTKVKAQLGCWFYVEDYTNKVENIRSCET